jgi:hypothetical protein
VFLGADEWKTRYETIANKTDDKAAGVTEKRMALFWVITHRVAVISYRHFGTTYRSHLQGLTTTHCVTTQKSLVLIYFMAEV